MQTRSVNRPSRIALETEHPAVQLDPRHDPLVQRRQVGLARVGVQVGGQPRRHEPEARDRQADRGAQLEIGPLLDPCAQVAGQRRIVGDPSRVRIASVGQQRDPDPQRPEPAAEAGAVATEGRCRGRSRPCPARCRPRRRRSSRGAPPCHAPAGIRPSAACRATCAGRTPPSRRARSRRAAGAGRRRARPARRRRRRRGTTVLHRRRPRASSSNGSIAPVDTVPAVPTTAIGWMPPRGLARSARGSSVHAHPIHVVDRDVPDVRGTRGPSMSAAAVAHDVGLGRQIEPERADPRRRLLGARPSRRVGREPPSARSSSPSRRRT